MKKRSTVLYIAVFMTAFFLVLPAVPAEAASRNVTPAMSGDKNLKRIVKTASAYTTAKALSADAKRGKIRLNAPGRLTIAAFAIYTSKDDAGFSTGELDSEAKALFGKGVKVGKILSAKPKGMAVCSSDRTSAADPYMYCGGDFGDVIPRCRIKKIEKINRSVYRVTVRNKIGVYGEKGSRKLGTTVFKLKKTKASPYGYIIKSIIYQ